MPENMQTSTDAATRNDENHHEMSSREGQAPLAEGFLAVAKDCRYVAAATQLIVQLLEGWNIAHSPSDAWYASAVFYVVLVMRRKGKTLGMDITGLQYPNQTSTKSRTRLFTQSIAGISVLYILHCWTEQQRETGGSIELRGSERVQAFRNRRRAMIQRSQDQDHTHGAVIRGGDTSDNSSALSELKEHGRRLWRRLLENLLVFQTGGPHDLSAQHVSAAWWCLRLYAAYYCLDGRFSSIGQYLLGLQVEKCDPDQKRLVNQPQSHRLVAMLVLSHTAGWMLQNASKSVLQWIVQKIHSNGDSQVRVRGGSLPQEPLSGICAICQQPRKNPACPIQCGHICCWTCLQKWIAFRGECPICRKTSRSQDIVALNHYQEPVEKEKII